MPWESPKMATVGGLPPREAGGGAALGAALGATDGGADGARSIAVAGPSSTGTAAAGATRSTSWTVTVVTVTVERTITAAVRSTGQVTSRARCAGFGLTRK